MMFDWIKEKNDKQAEKKTEKKEKPPKVDKEDIDQNNLLMNKHLQTNINGDNEVQPHRINKNERLGTQFANYNTTVQVTDVPVPEEPKKNDTTINKYSIGNTNNNTHIKQSSQPVGDSHTKTSTGKDKKKKTKKDNKGCIIF